MTTPTTAADSYALIAAAPPGRVWLADARRTVTYGELLARVQALGGWLDREGIGVGARVVVASRDDVEVALLFVALVWNGVTAITLDPEMSGERARALIRKSAPTLLLADTALLAAWDTGGLGYRQVELTAPAPRGLLDRLRGKQPAAAGLAGLLAAATPRPPPAAIPPETLAYILFTSGTTRQPKGVCISHRALFGHLATLARVYGVDEGSRVLNPLMLSHADGMINGPALATYATATLLRPMRFEITGIERLLDALYQLRATHLFAVPTMLALLARLGTSQRDAFQGGGFHRVIACGAQLEAKLWQDFETIFAVRLINEFGLTETVAGGCFAGHDDATRRPGSIGRPEDCEVRIVDADGRALEGPATGELWMRGSLLMSGYFEEPELTAEVLGEGWLRTGDIARRDADGLLWIVGRAKNIIIRGGLNIHPEEITEVLHHHAGVREAVCFGVADRDWGEVVVALVEGAGLDEAGLIAHAAARLEPRKVPTRILVVDGLPRGRSGKVVLSEARELYARLVSGGAPAARGASDGASPSSADDAADRVLSVAAACFKRDKASLHLSATPAEVPGWDSLAHLELVMALEKAFGVTLSAREIVSITSLDRALAVVTRR